MPHATHRAPFTLNTLMAAVAANSALTISSVELARDSVQELTLSVAVDAATGVAFHLGGAQDSGPADAAELRANGRVLAPGDHVVVPLSRDALGVDSVTLYSTAHDASKVSSLRRALATLAHSGC